MKRAKHLAGWGRNTFLLMTAVCLVLFGTGIVMFVLPVTDLMEMSSAQVALRRIASIAHGVSTWLFCILCGRGVWPHVKVMWNKQGESVKWALGLVNLSVFIAIGLTGLLLLYANPDLHDEAAWLHFWMGALSPLIFLTHSWRRFVPSKFD